MSKRARAGEKKRRGGKGFSRNEKIVGLVILVIIVWAVYSASQPFSPPATTATTQTSATQTGGAPDFSLPVVDQNGLTGQSVSLSQFRGKVVLLEFMTPNCPHCQTMAPALENLYRQYSRDKVVFLTVVGSWGGQSANDAARFIRDYRSSWTYVYDSSGTTFDMYGVTGTPTFFVIAKNGEIAARYIGETPADTLARDINRLSS
jgi:thiol-disulfide isomerase/thioredoxin